MPVARTLLLATLLAAPGAVRGEVCPTPAGAAQALADVPTGQRIAWLRERLDAERGPARAWSRTWVLVDGGLAAGQLVAIPTMKGEAERAILAAGAATSAAGVAQILLLPITPREVAPGAGCDTLGALEASLDRSARNQAVGAGALAHGTNVFVNVALGVATGLTSGRWTLAAFTIVGGTAIGEAQILTQPTALVAARAQYRAGALDPPRALAPRASRWTVAGVAAQRGGVLTITVIF